MAIRHYKAPPTFRDDWTRNSFAENLQRLRRITDGCRPDMHEPDEQDVTAVVSGVTLDNAGVRGELMVRIDRGNSREDFNLASLIALARLARIPAR